MRGQMLVIAHAVCCPLAPLPIFSQVRLFAASVSPRCRVEGVSIDRLRTVVSIAALQNTQLPRCPAHLDYCDRDALGRANGWWGGPRRARTPPPPQPPAVDEQW